MGKPTPANNSVIVEKDAISSGPKKILSKSAKRKLKKKLVRDARRALNANKPPKPTSQIKLPASIVLPEHTSNSATLDDVSLLTEIRRRIGDQHKQTVRVAPVPKLCTPLLLQDLCPTAVAVRLPSRKNTRYAFIEFKSSAEAKAMAERLNGQLLNGKVLTAMVCSDKPVVKQIDWKPLEERELEAFDLTSLYVSRLPRFTDRSDLAQIFRTASRIKFESFPDGTCKGFCTLKYRSRNQAQEEFIRLHGTLFKGIPIFVNFVIKPKVRSIEESANGRKRQSILLSKPDTIDVGVEIQASGGAQSEPERSFNVRKKETQIVRSSMREKLNLIKLECEGNAVLTKPSLEPNLVRFHSRRRTINPSLS